MTDQQQQERPGAGRALDAEVATRVMGWKHAHGCGRCVHCPGGHRFQLPDGSWRTDAEIPRYSTDYGEAMRLFEALVEMTGAGYIIADMEDARGEGFVVNVAIGIDDEVRMIGPFPEVIARAALTAVQAARQGTGEG